MYLLCRERERERVVASVRALVASSNCFCCLTKSSIPKKWRFYLLDECLSITFKHFLNICVTLFSLGAFNFLKENFSNAPSLDMSAPSLCMLVRLMVSQVQECVFERVTLTTEDTHFTSQLRLAQEAARVSRRVAGRLVTSGAVNASHPVCACRCQTCICWCSRP